MIHVIQIIGIIAIIAGVSLAVSWFEKMFR